VATPYSPLKAHNEPQRRIQFFPESILFTAPSFRRRYAQAHQCNPPIYGVAAFTAS
jgi:hypothetical protein